MYPYPFHIADIGFGPIMQDRAVKIQYFLGRATSERGRTQWVRFTKSEEWRNDPIVVAIIAPPPRIQVPL